MTSATAIAAVALALPWFLGPLAVYLRARASRSLGEESAVAPSGAPLLSVIIPARNEARNIGRCVRSALATSYPAVEVIVVDDHSTDGTGAIAREAGRGDARLRVIENPDLPPEWFGKPWACAGGASAARGELLCFTDADTEHGPELLVRAVNAMHAHGADAISVAGRQELGSFWERVIQPQMFYLLLARYGGSETVRRSRRVEDKIANGQFILVRRDAYDAIGGHGSVRGEVAEDLMLAQRLFAAGKELVLVAGTAQLTTRMYTSLAELLEGWGKNVFAGGRNAMPFGRVGRIIYPLVLVLAPVLMLLPPLGLVAGLTGLAGDGVLLWGAITATLSLLTWMAMYRSMREPPVYALLFPLGSAMLLYICVTAIARGRRVAWKGREYSAG